MLGTQLDLCLGKLREELGINPIASMLSFLEVQKMYWVFPKRELWLSEKPLLTLCGLFLDSQ